MRLLRACDCYSVYCDHNPNPKAPLGANYRVYIGPRKVGGLFIGRENRDGPGKLFVGRCDPDGGYTLIWPKELRDWQRSLR